MFDSLMITLVVLSLGSPAVPWMFGARRGAREIWWSTGFAAAVLLCLFPMMFETACIASACGQGAIAIFVLAPISIASAVLTVGSVTVSHYSYKR